MNNTIDNLMAELEERQAVIDAEAKAAAEAKAHALMIKGLDILAAASRNGLLTIDELTALMGDFTVSEATWRGDSYTPRTILHSSEIPMLRIDAFADGQYIALCFDNHDCRIDERHTGDRYRALQIIKMAMDYEAHRQAVTADDQDGDE